MSEILARPRFHAVGRTVVGAAVAGPAGILAYFVVSYLWEQPARRFDDLWLGFETFALLSAYFGAIIGWPAMLLGGIPAHALLYKWKFRQFWAYCLAGAAIGPLAIAVWFSIPPGGSRDYFDFFSRISAPIGAFAALVFWLIRRPDRDAPPAPAAQPQ